MNEKVQELKGKSLLWYNALSQREQFLVVGGVLVLAFLFIQYAIIDPASGYLSGQAQRLEDAKKEMKQLPYVLGSYKRLKQRHLEIEELYKKIELPEGAFAHLESLVKNKAGIPAASFTIKEGNPVEFGTQYQQIPYTIRFRITDYERLIDFLDEVMNGAKPLVISSLDMRKGRLGDHIQVNLQVTSVRRVVG